MARVKTLHVQLGRTIGQKNYSSISISLGETIELDESDDPRVERKISINRLKKKMEFEVSKILDT